jgi:biopolymer transport protein ExbD
MSKVSKEVLEEIDSDLQMTPMIDVTFLLLVFFLCATKFKTLERKLDSYLPKDTGPAPTPPPDDRLPTEIWLKVKGADKDLCDIFFGRTKVDSYAELERRIRARHDTDEKRKNLALNIYGSDELRWEYVVRAFDVAIGAGVEKVQFGVGRDNKGITVRKPG